MQTIYNNNDTFYINTTGSSYFGGTITVTSQGTSHNWYAGYNYSQVGHLPIVGGTLTGDLQANGGISTNRARTEYIDLYKDGGIDFLLDGSHSSQSIGTCRLLLRSNHTGYSSSARQAIQFQTGKHGSTITNNYHIGFPSTGAGGGLMCFATGYSNKGDVL